MKAGAKGKDQLSGDDGAAVLAATSDQNGSAVITLSASDSITLDGVLTASLDQAGFIV